MSSLYRCKFAPILAAPALLSIGLLMSGRSVAREIVLYNQPDVAAGIESVLFADAHGTLYGTGAGSGAGNNGAVFALSRPAEGQKDWTESILYAFQGGNDGSFPVSALTPDGKGGFFGTTAYGGGGSCSLESTSGCGIVFHLSPPASGQTVWTETVLYRFQGGSDGALLYAPVLYDAVANVLYGTTFIGGASNAGTVFALTPPTSGETWTETVLYSFTGGVDGGFPSGGLIADETGTLYSTTTAGGTTGSGAVFKLTPPASGHSTWTETVIYSFLGFGFSDGATPYAGLVADAAGNLFGTTISGGAGNTSGVDENTGTVFELSPPAAGQSAYTEAVLYSFSGQKDGASPSGILIIDANGSLYSTTTGGGPMNNGTVFKLSPPTDGSTVWSEKVLHSFRGPPDDGNYPFSGGLLAARVGKSTALFGATFYGGTDAGGVVFEITDSGFAQ